MLINRAVLLAKVEATPGVDASPSAGTDSKLVENVSWSYAGARFIERRPVSNTLGGLQGVFAGTLMEMSFDVELKGSGTAGTAPEIGTLFRGCAMDETVNAGTSVDYAPVSEGMETVTIYYYEDGLVYKLTGARGTFSVAANAGERGLVSFTFTGHISGPEDSALPVGSYDSTVPPPYINAPFQVGGYGPVISALAFDAANTVATPPSVSAADGFSEIVITDRAPAGSFDPENTLVASQDWVSDWQQNASKAITSGVVGGTAGNRWELTIPQAYYMEVGAGDRDGIRSLEIGFGATGGDSAYQITFS